MASIEKRGSNYRITVNNGIDMFGDQIRERVIYEPDQAFLALSPKKQESYLKRFADDFERTVKSGNYLKGEKIKYSEYIKTWLELGAKQKLSERAYEDYADLLSNLILPALGHIRLSKISPTHLLKFYGNLQEDGVRLDGKPGGYGNATIKKCRAVISSSLTDAVEWQYIRENPCSRAKTPKVQKEKAKDDPKHFTPEQTLTFLDALDKTYISNHKGHSRLHPTGKIYKVRDYKQTYKVPFQLKVFYYLDVTSGCRRGELIALEWDRINFDTSEIIIDRSTTIGKRKTITKTTKTDERLTMTIPAVVMDMLKKLKKEQLEYRLSIGDKWKGNGKSVFIRDDGRQMYPSTPYRAFKRILQRYNADVKKESEMLPDIALHGLRHTMATLLIGKNVDIKTVSARLNHSNTATTMNIYAHALAELDKTAANTLDDMLTGAAK